MSSARPPGQPRRGAHARHGGSRDRTGVRDQPGAGGSGRGQDGYGESGRRAPRHAGPPLDEPDYRAPGDRQAAHWGPGHQRPGDQGAGYKTLAVDEMRAGAPSYASPEYAGPGYADRGHAGPAYDVPGYAAPGYGDPGYGERGYAEPGYGEPGYGEPGYRGPGYGEPGHGGHGYRDPRQPGPIHPGPGQPDDRRDHGLPGRDRHDYGLRDRDRRDLATAGHVSQRRSHRRQGHPPASGSRPDVRRARAQDRSGPRRGRRRGRRTLIWLGTGLLVVAGAIAAVLLLRPAPAGPAHILTTPARLGAYLRRPQLARQMGVAQLEKGIIARSSGQASHLVSAVYQDGSTVPGGPAPKILLFIGGKLAGAPADASIKSFDQHFRGAAQTSPGPLGGRAACVPGQPGTGGAAVCAWFDDDTFGELVSPHMTASALAGELRAIRPSIERLSRHPASRGQ